MYSFSFEITQFQSCLEHKVNCAPVSFSSPPLGHLCASSTHNYNESAFCRLLKTDLYRRGWAGGASE